MLFVVICFVLCWTPYYCIVFFLIITDTRIDNEHPIPTVDDLASPKSSGPDERPLLIFMMLAVSNSVLDPLIYGNAAAADRCKATRIIEIAPFHFKGCFMVQPIKSRCCRQLRTRKETATFRRHGHPPSGDKESKLTTIRTHVRHENQPHHMDAPIECEL